MTFSNTRSHDISFRSPATVRAGDEFGGFSPLFQTLMSAALLLLARYGRRRGPKTRHMAALALIAVLTLYKGTREEKRAFLRRLLAQHTAVQERLYARYLVWRQRKCWMWGGGFYAGSLTGMGDVFTAARDQVSYEALIPD